MSAPDPREIAAMLLAVTDIEAKHRGTITQTADEHALFTPWMPFEPYKFVALAAEAVAAVNFPADGSERPRFFEVGAGPGTKMLILRDLFGFSVRGIERTDSYAEAGRAMGLDVITADAGVWTAYHGYPLIWFNRVFRDVHAQELLERRVWDCASDGAVIMCANLETRPPWSWYPVLDAWDDERYGIWQKPSVSGAS